MKSQETNNKTVNAFSEEETLVWRAPELTVISVSNTKSGLTSSAPTEGEFYSPSGAPRM